MHVSGPSPLTAACNENGPILVNKIHPVAGLKLLCQGHQHLGCQGVPQLVNPLLIMEPIIPRLISSMAIQVRASVVAEICSLADHGAYHPSAYQQHGYSGDSLCCRSFVSLDQGWIKQ